MESRSTPQQFYIGYRTIVGNYTISAKSSFRTLIVQIKSKTLLQNSFRKIIKIADLTQFHQNHPSKSMQIFTTYLTFP